MSEQQRSKARLGDTASKVAIAGAVESAIPNIAGYNFFTGEFTPTSANAIGTAVCTQEEWEALWKAFDRLPPGKLPKDSRAVFEALSEAMKLRATAFEPANVTMSTASDILINWNRVHIGKEDDAAAKPRYAVLLIPDKGKLTSRFNDVWPVREKREKMKQFDESLSLFRKGSPPISSPATAKFTQYRARRNVGPGSKH